MRLNFTNVLRAGAAGAVLSGIAAFTSPALAQSGCGAAMADFQSALKANTAEALAGYLDEHAPCFEAPVRTRLEALGGAPKAVAAPRYDGPEIRLNVLGSPSYLGPTVAQAEASYWADAVPAIGNVSVDIAPDYGDFGGLEYSRAVANGDIDAALVFPAPASTLEGPFGTVLAGLGVPLAAADAATARSLQAAVRDRVSEAMAEAGLVLLGAAPVMPRLMVCTEPVARLDDLKGKKIRFASAPRVVEALGGENVTLSISDMRPAFERDVVDCFASVAPLFYRNDVHRMGGHVVSAAVIDRGMAALVMNADAYNALPEPVRTGLLEAARTGFEEPVWSKAEAAIAADIGCMVGQGACPEGVEPGNLTASNPLPFDATAKRLLSEVVLPKWAETAPASLVDGWRADASTVIDIAR